MSTCQPFSIMRLTHEAIRAGLNEVKNLSENTSDLESQEGLAKLRKAYYDTKRTIVLHATQENDVFYEALEKKSEGISKAFVEEHDHEEEMFEKLDSSFEIALIDRSHINQLVIDLNEWIDDHEHHLEHEEGILMSVLPEVFTYMESIHVVRDIIALDLEEYESFQLPWVYERLKVPQREVYLGMLKGCSPEGKFNDFLNKVGANTAGQ